MKKQVPLLILALVFVAGCATTNRNYQPDLEALNAKVSSLQGQLDGKNRELSSLQDQVRGLQTQLNLANSAKDDAEARLVQALDRLAAKTADCSGGTASNIVTKKGSYVK